MVRIDPAPDLTPLEVQLLRRIAQLEQERDALQDLLVQQARVRPPSTPAPAQVTRTAR